MSACQLMIREIDDPWNFEAEISHQGAMDHWMTTKSKNKDSSLPLFAISMCSQKPVIDTIDIHYFYCSDFGMLFAKLSALA